MLNYRLSEMLIFRINNNNDTTIMHHNMLSMKSL